MGNWICPNADCTNRMSTPERIHLGQCESCDSAEWGKGEAPLPPNAYFPTRVTVGVLVERYEVIQDDASWVVFNTEDSVEVSRTPDSYIAEYDCYVLNVWHDALAAATERKAMIA